MDVGTQEVQLSGNIWWPADGKDDLKALSGI